MSSILYSFRKSSSSEVILINSANDSLNIYDLDDTNELSVKDIAASLSNTIVALTGDGLNDIKSAILLSPTDSTFNP